MHAYKQAGFSMGSNSQVLILNESGISRIESDAMAYPGAGLNDSSNADSDGVCNYANLRVCVCAWVYVRIMDKIIAGTHIQTVFSDANM
jgi:hypothetical protein